MEIAGKTLRRRVLTALAVFVVLVVWDYAAGSSVEWVVNLLVPALFFLFSVLVDLGIERWLRE
ncbi:MULTISPECIES: hypothetical protein [Halolamina]|uniref:Uncharacterized protein n=1 Tax=Halolamina pelagica TaxID=699431 RepID=A0A1I5SFW4_9EURY|nr:MULTISPECIES: hypothetical protein [Halolamina]NHX37087.1 hypothetical protein [Halolamina sp. R1-12]SFP69387.1 hypothetical protein SAMN05216277_10690 [Halolamina pelagica]